MSILPAIVLAFSNDWVDNRRHLRSLLEEGKAISEALGPLVEAGVLTLPPPIHNASVNDVLAIFRERRYRDQIRVFHFGGHASGSKLMFEDDTGAPDAVHAKGLAGFLARQPGLVLVFLNGCCTKAQVRQLRAAGVKAVVATTSAIDDKVAAGFATAFYSEMAARSLRDAFDTAVQAMQLRWGGDPQSVTRDVAVGAEEEVLGTAQWPWILDCDPDYEGWTLGSERRADRSWRHQLLFAVVAMSLVLTTSLVINSEARRTMCRVPGLRSVCVAVGIGNVPAASEQALWDNALRQDTEDGLREYLRTYPRGAFVDEARSRLDGCRFEHVETLGPERSHRYRWRVNPTYARFLRTEDEARRNALERGYQDAATTCESLASKALLLLSAQAEPHEWRCTQDEHGFACGFDGDIVCRLQDRIEFDREHCRHND